MLIKKIGIFGLGVMGKNLAINLSNKGYKISVYNRTHKKTYKLISKKYNNIYPFFKIKDFINSLNYPKCIFIMVKSGISTEKTINSILPFLKKNDIIIDAGNSFYKDTIKRYKKLSLLKINFLGIGISGGKKGALKGPCIMPGGSKKSYKLISPILKKISAYINKKPCVTYIGPNGSGHYVKMIHNGIEYSIMQIISETYIILKNGLKYSNKKISKIFKKWNKGILKSYLIKITYKILLHKKKNKNSTIDYILDTIDHKNTGKWTSKSALDLNVPSTIVTESVFFRYLSSLRKERIKAKKILKGPKKHIKINKKKFIKTIKKSLYFSILIAFSQSFTQLKKASKKYKWSLNYKKITKIFRNGCIIKSKLLNQIISIYKKNKNINNLILSKYFTKISNKYNKYLRKTIIYAIKIGIPTPGFCTTINYYDAYRSTSLSGNIIQAQRNYFGEHPYKRIDKKGQFNTKWK